ncbi:uncharacterized protein LOC142796448 isoform X1 [Rhipicephalus microplus]|uniref:uncharacterized protein LOC142796448 isoform X1 n=1 Tax=Rhipicephalus microplus TaxID=6941 RepID=UPI003F6CFA46
MLLASNHESFRSSFFSSAVELFFSGGYSVRIRDSNTPGRKVGLWGCDFCAFTHADVSKVQAHVQEQHMAALRRIWETTAWQAGESRGDALCSDESSGVVDSCSAVQPQMASRQQFRFPPMPFAPSEDSGSSMSAFEPIVICKIDDDDEEEKDCMHRAGPSF